MGCNVADPRDPFPQGPPAEPQHSGEQAEVATALTQTLFFQPTMVAAYRFTGPMPLGDIGNDIEYGANNGLTFRDGASLMGYSTSVDGLKWSRGVKVFPHLVQQFVGDPVAILWGDPSIATGLKWRPLVAYSALAISQAGFDSKKGMDGALHCWPGSSAPSFMCSGNSIVDSVCVAVSIDGAQSFPWLYCKHPSDLGIWGTDQPSVGVDKDDRIFVVVDDFFNKKLDLYQLDLFQPPYFFPCTIDSRMGDASHTPRISRDQDGELWLATSRPAGTPDVRLCHIRPATATSPGSCDFVGVVTQMAEPFPTLLSSNIGNVRTGLTVSFAANRVRTSPPVLPHTDFYFAYHLPRDGADRFHIGATECQLPVIGTFACQDVSQWGTGTGAQQLQPALTVVDRSAAGDGTKPDVQYAYYNVDADDVAPGRARVRRAILSGSPFTGVVPGVITEDLPLAPDPAVCTAKYAPGYEYWGDFFGFQHVFRRHVVIYSSNEPSLALPGCSSQTHNFQGHPLHLQSWFWPN